MFGRARGGELSWRAGRATVKARTEGGRKVSQIVSETLIERLAYWDIDIATTLFRDKVQQLKS